MNCGFSISKATISARGNRKTSSPSRRPCASPPASAMRQKSGTHSRSSRPSAASAMSRGRIVSTARPSRSRRNRSATTSRGRGSRTCGRGRAAGRSSSARGQSERPVSCSERQRMKNRSSFAKATIAKCRGNTPRCVRRANNCRRLRSSRLTRRRGKLFATLSARSTGNMRSRTTASAGA